MLMQLKIILLAAGAFLLYVFGYYNAKGKDKQTNDNKQLQDLKDVNKRNMFWGSLTNLAKRDWLRDYREKK